jgi:hypothetical protein
MSRPSAVKALPSCRNSDEDFKALLLLSSIAGIFRNTQPQCQNSQRLLRLVTVTLDFLLDVASVVSQSLSLSLSLSLALQFPRATQAH